MKYNLLKTDFENNFGSIAKALKHFKFPEAKFYDQVKKNNLLVKDLERICNDTNINPLRYLDIKGIDNFSSELNIIKEPATDYKTFSKKIDNCHDCEILKNENKELHTKLTQTQEKLIKLLETK